MTAAVTPWFGCDLKPVRAGYYDALYAGDRKSDRRRYFNGANWTYGPSTTCVLAFGRNSGDKWRGLAADPAGGAK